MRGETRSAGGAGAGSGAEAVELRLRHLLDDRLKTPSFLRRFTSETLAPLCSGVDRITEAIEIRLVHLNNLVKRSGPPLARRTHRQCEGESVLGAFGENPIPKTL